MTYQSFIVIMKHDFVGNHIMLGHIACNAAAVQKMSLLSLDIGWLS